MQTMLSIPFALNAAVCSIAGQVPGRAGRRKGARNREQHDTLAAKKVLRRELPRALGGCNHELHGGQRVAGLNHDGCGSRPYVVKML